MVETVRPEMRNLFANISLSARTVTRRVEQLSDNVKKTLEIFCTKFEYYSMALDESADIKGTLN